MCIYEDDDDGVDEENVKESNLRLALLERCTPKGHRLVCLYYAHEINASASRHGFQYQTDDWWLTDELWRIGATYTPS